VIASQIEDACARQNKKLQPREALPMNEDSHAKTFLTTEQQVLNDLWE
jgi:hypothetical protein